MNDLTTTIANIRRTTPSLIAKQITSVQPMEDDTLKNLYKIKAGRRKRDKFGDLIHDFIKGFMVYDGKEFITVYRFKEKFPDLNYDELNNHKNMWRKL